MACCLAPGNKDLTLFVWWESRVKLKFGRTIIAQNFFHTLLLTIGKGLDMFGSAQAALLRHIRLLLNKDPATSNAQPVYKPSSVMVWKIKYQYIKRVEGHEWCLMPRLPYHPVRSSHCICFLHSFAILGLAWATMRIKMASSSPTLDVLFST